MSIFADLKRYAEGSGRPRVGRPPNTKQIHRVQPSGDEAIVWAIDFGRELDRLRPEERTAVLLIHGAGYAATEVSCILGLSATTVGRRCEAGMMKLLKNRDVRRRCNGQ